MTDSPLARAYVDILPNLKKFSARLKNETRRAVGTSGDEGGKKFSQQFTDSSKKEFSGTFERVIGAELAKSLLKVGAAASSASLAGGVLAALTAGFVSFTAAVGPAVGAAAAIPALYAAVGQGAIVAKIGMLGLEKALQGDEDAIKSLSPKAKTFVKTIGDLKPAFDKVRKSIQNELFSGLSRQVKLLASNYLPLLKTAGTGTARVLNNLAKQGAALANTAAFRADFATVTRANTQNLAKLGQAGLSLANVFRNLLVTVQPLTARFASFLQGAASQLDKVVTSGRKTGDLARFFKTAGDTAAQLGRILANIGVSLFRFFQAGASGGRGLLDTLEQATFKLRAFTNTAAGSQAMNKFFTTGQKNLAAIGRLLGDIGSRFGSAFGSANLAPLIDQIRVGLVPALDRLFQSFNEADVLPKLVDAITSLVNVVAASGGSVAAFATTLAALSRAIELLVVNVPGASTALGALATVAGVQLAARMLGLGAAVGFLNGQLVVLARASLAGAVLQAKLFYAGLTSSQAAASAFSGFAGTLGGVVKTVSVALAAAARETALFAARMVALAAARTAAFAMTVLSTAVRAVGAALLFASANPIVLVIAGLIALGVALFVAYQKSATFRAIVNAAFAAVASFVTATLGVLRTVIVATLTFIASWWQATFGRLAPIVVAVFGLIAAVVRLYMAVIQGVIALVVNNLLSIIRTGFNQIRAVVTVVVSGIAVVVRSYFGIIRAVVTTLVGAARAVVVSNFNQMRAVVGAVLGAIRAVVSGGFSAVRAIISGAVKAAKAVVSAAFSAMHSSVANKIGSIVSTVRGFGGKIVGAVAGFGGLLVHAGAALVQGLISGVTSKLGALTSVVDKMTSLVKKFLPGSPVDVGPLRVLNRGYAGGQIVSMLADGIRAKLPELQSAIGAAVAPLAAGGLNPALAGTGGGSAPAAPAAVSGGTPMFDVRVYIGDRELTDLVRVEIAERDRATARSAAAGAGSRN